MSCLERAVTETEDGGSIVMASRPAQPTHDRLLDAVTAVAARDGYAHLTVEKILTQAGVSRATFYQYFLNLDDCFRHAYRAHADRLVSEVARAVAGSGPPARTALQVVVNMAISRPPIARLLVTEGLGAGPVGLLERDALIGRVSSAIASTEDPRAVDLPTEILVGGTFRFLAMRLEDGGVDDAIRGDVLEWARTFARRASDPSWSARFMPALAEDRSRSVADPRPLRLSGTPRERILHATGTAVRERGYRAMTVADIVSAARVSRRSFYNKFPNKAAAFIAAYEHAFEQMLAACTPAFFSSVEWPERVWQSILASARRLAREPGFAYIGFVECHALGQDFAPRVHQTQLAFTLFLEEGYRQCDEARRLSRSCSALTATAIAEAGFRAARGGPSLYMRLIQPLAVYIALTPFIGSEAASTFVAAKLSATNSGAPAPS